jgi:phosphopantothenoylcysteine decarboxylase/phosphopantothenate--cysteine ligase
VSRHIILGVTASIALHRALDITSILRKKGDRVSVVMTPSAKKLISPVTFQAISLDVVYHDMWATSESMDHDHIRMAQTGDALVIAPATAGTIGKLAHGILDNILLTTAFAFDGPKYIAPAMNWRMWENSVVQNNCQLLIDQGWQMIQPVAGDLACGEQGIGRLAPVDDIVAALDQPKS